MKRQIGISVIIGLSILALVGTASAGSITEGFEGASYNLAGNGNGTATLSTSVVHSGSQSVELNLPDTTDYARVKLDITSYDLTLGQITSANVWVNKTGSSEQAPYFLFSITTPGGGTDTTLAVMYNNPSIPSNGTWYDLTLDTNQMFHVEGDTTGLTNPSGMTLAQLDSSLYAPGVAWGSLPVDFVRVGAGSAGGGEFLTAYVDDLTINYTNSPSATPEPSSFLLLGTGVLGLAGAVRRKLLL
jgi:hypothetical protein